MFHDNILHLNQFCLVRHFSLSWLSLFIALHVLFEWLLLMAQRIMCTEKESRDLHFFLKTRGYKGHKCNINRKRFENVYSCTIILLFYFSRLLRQKRKGSSEECPIFSLDVQETNKQQTTLKILFPSRCFLTQNNVNLKFSTVLFE